MIEINNLYKQYGEKMIFEGLNLSINENRVSCITGPSGCGKTTLLKMIAGIENYNQGEILGVSHKRMSMVFQEDCLMPWLTVEDNIRYVMSHFTESQQAKKIEWVLGVLQLKNYGKSKLNELSGGMKRRVAIARALVYDSELMLLDEPFRGLDEQLRWSILEKLKDHWYCNRQTVLLVTHDIMITNQFDQYIDLGRYVEGK